MAQPNVEAPSKRELQSETQAPPEVVAAVQQLLTMYYQTFDTNRAALAALYRPESRLIFEGECYTGVEKIILKLTSLPFKQVVHDVTTFDCSLTIDQSIMILVVGRLKADEDSVFGFTQSFNVKQIGDSETFAKMYYSIFDANRAQLGNLYREESMLTFEGQQFQGKEQIVEKLVKLPFNKITHDIATIDVQPSLDKSVLVFVIGQLKTDDDPPHGFSQVFLLKPTDGENYFVLNDQFRLSLHHQ